MKKRSFSPDSEIRREQIIIAASEKAQSTIEGDQFKMDDFRKHYGVSAVDEDIDELNNIKKRIKAKETTEQKKKEFAQIFEAILIDQIEQSMWFGEDVSTRAASKYDDYVNGVDIIATVDIDGIAASHTGMAMDATFTQFSYKKIDKIINTIKKGDSTVVKYFKGSGFTGQLDNIPRVVLAAQGGNVEALAHTWVTNKNGLVEHPVILQLADQIFKQLEKFYLLSKKMHGDNHELTDMYKRQYMMWSGIFEKLDLDTLEKHEAADQFLDGDTAHTALIRYVDSIKI